MATPRFAWGIDIGNRALKAIRLSVGAEGLKIDDFDVVEHDQVLSNAGDNKDSLIQSALVNFVQRHEMKGGSVAIGVSGQSSFARFIKLPPVEPRKIPEIVRFEAIQQIPFPLDEVEWSYQLFQDPASPDVEVGIFAMRRELVSQYVKIFTDLSLNVQVVQMNPLAVYNAMYADDRLKGTTMIIDLGAENTDLIIAEGETIWLRTIPIGGNNFTEALVKAFKLKFPKAEELKRNASTSKYGRQILQAMKPVFNELVAEIQRSIGFYASVHRESRITRVLALGGTFRLPGLQKYVQQNLQIDVHRIDRLGAGAPAEARVATIFNENILSSVSAYGLAIQALGGAKISSSLLPQSIRRERMWREKNRWFGAAAAVFLAAPLVAWGAIQWGQRNLLASAQINRENQNFVNVIKTDDQNWDTSVEQAGAGDRTRTVNFNSLVQGRDTQTAILDAIVGCLPNPSPALLSGDKTKMGPRNMREEIRLDRITFDYHANMAPMLALSEDAFKELSVPAQAPKIATGLSGSGQPTLAGRRASRDFRPIGSPIAAPAAQGGPTQRGYVIEIVCTTPRSDGPSYVLNNFASKLQKVVPAQNPPLFAIKRVIEPFSMTLGSDSSLRTTVRAASPLYGLSRADRYALPEAANAGQPAPFNPLMDPVTGEDMSNDTRVTVRMMVILDPPAANSQGG